MKVTKRLLCLLLALVMVSGYFPGVLQASASQADGICPKHHPEHSTEDCEYVAGAPCKHEESCDDTCRQLVTDCVYDHTDCGCAEEVPPTPCSHAPEVGCDYAEKIAAIVCICPEGDDGTVAHTDDCTLEAQKAAVQCDHYLPGTPAQSCSHVCSADSGCITMQCGHETHDETCGYVGATPCKFVGEECEQCALDQTPSPASDVQTQPMYARISGEDGNGNEIVNYLESMTHAGNSEGPWLCFVPSRDVDTVFVGFTSSDPNVVTLEYSDGNENNPYLRFIYGEEGTATITHTEGETVYSFTVTVTEPEIPTLRYRIDDMNLPQGGMWQMSPNFSCNVKFYIGTNSFTQVDQPNEEPHSLTNVTVENNAGVIELTAAENRFYTIKALKEGTATIVYENGDNRYTLNIVVRAQEYRMIPVQPEGAPNWIDLQGINGPVDLRCVLAEMYGPPVDGTSLIGLTSSDENVFTLSLKDGAAGIYTLTPTGPGTAQIRYEEGDKTYSCEVTVMDKSFKADGLVYYPAVHSMSGKTYPKTVLNMGVNQWIEKEFYYSQAAEVAMLADEDSGLTPLSINQVTYSGAITVTAGETAGTLRITSAGEPGTGYLEVTSEDGITHCFVVNVGRAAPDTEVDEGGYMWLDDDVVIGFGNPGIPSGGDNNAEPGVLKMRAQINNGFFSTSPEESRFREPMCFAAMNKTEGTVAANVMNAVRNVQFSVLACRNTDGTTIPYPSVELAACEQVSLAEGDVKPWTNYLVAGGKEAFKGLVGMTFDLPDGTITRRISLYILTHNTYMGQDVTVEANITSAAQLNVILSSYEALKTWIKAEYPEYADVVDNACNVDLKLPGGDFTDTVVVSEAIAPFPFKPNPSSNPNFRVYLRAPTQGKKTKLAGLISRGSLAGIHNVNFEATEGVTMTRGEERFTCGLMADSQWSGTVVYDMEFAAQYGIDPYANKRNLSSWTNDGGMQYADCDILTVDGCSFDGFDYGTRSTPNGYVGGGVNNSFTKCFYGIYIDCPNKPGWGEIHYTGFGGYDFKKNVVAVRIVALQKNVTPYEFRIHDCDFINNYLEFWINEYQTTHLQNYYFYRNHYSGGWNKPTGNWYKYGSDALGNEILPEVDHRGPKYSEETNNGVTVNVSGTPGRATPNLAVNRSASTEGYWIYDGEDQVTRIEYSGDKLPIAQEALESLTEDADVSIVANQGSSTLAIWTFEGGE